ncbi:MAG: SLC13 family permease [Bacteroidales bacterium]|nr:SLC13 family permease [Bacteroidales bacterium]
MLTFDIILVFFVLIFILISLYREILGPAFTFLIAIIILGIFGILTPTEIIQGFANEQVAVVIMLLLLGDIIRRTSVIENVFDRLFRYAKSYKGFLTRMMVIVSTFSAFLNNTPLVAIMMPYVHSWCKRNDYSPSKFLIPLSYAAILGGSVTLIGTSTNLIVNGLWVEQNLYPGVKSLQIFDFAAVGIPMVLFGTLYILFFGHKKLPDKADALDMFKNQSREYFIEAKVKKNSRLIGKTVDEAGLSNVKGLILVEILRRSFRISPMAPEIVLDHGDVLVFAGETENIADLINSDSGLLIPEMGMLSKIKNAQVIEVVVSQNSPLINKTLKEFNFRSRYDAAVLAIHRNGEKIEEKIGNVNLRAGDVLLLYSGEDFANRTMNTQDFYFISKIRDFRKLEWYKILLLFGGTAMAILLSAFHIISLFMGLLIVIVASLALDITKPKELPKSIDYNLALIIVMSLALGTAMIKSGAALLIANILITIFMPMGKVGLLFGTYLITTFLAAYITNKAAVGIIFPIAISIAHNLDINAIPFVLTVSYAAAANFMTPIGYQTNLMVYGPGGYSFKDFFKIGFPLTIIYMITTVAILSLIYF